MDSYYFTAACYESLRRNLPNATFKDATTLVNWIKVIKSPREIEYMERAARIIERTMQAGIDGVRPGARQCDAAAAIYSAQISGTEDFGGDYTGLVPMLPTGIGTSTPHITWSDRPFVTGEATILELAGCHQRYHCPMARTVHLGKPPQKLADTAKVVAEGLNTALEAARPGVTCEAVEAAWRGAIARHGIVKDSRIGYSTGLMYPPDWGESTLSLRPGDKTVLQPGMTIHMIPGIWLDDWGVEISECFQVTESGAQRFADFPQDLVVKD
jgi:Xaa-Pro aminopeptidase